MKCLNCGKEVPQTPGKRPRLYCDNKGACKQKHWVKMHPKKSKKKTIELPADYVNWKSVGILKEDGTVEELKDISQLPDTFKDAMRALGELKLNTTTPTTITYHGKEKKASVTDKVEPAEGTMAFFNKYGVMTKAEIKPND